MADFNAKQKKVDDDQAEITRLQAELVKIAQELNDCERRFCNVGSGAPPVPLQDDRNSSGEPPKKAEPPKTYETPVNPPVRGGGNNGNGSRNNNGGGVIKSVTVGIVLPQDLPAGQMVTGSVIADPEKFKNIPGVQVIETAIATSTGTLDGAVVDTGDGKPQSANHFTWLVPVGLTAAGLLVSTLDHPEQQSTATVPVSTTPRPVTDLPVEYTTPGASLTKIQEIRGPIDGNTTHTTATINKQPANIVASEPGKLYVDMSNANTGLNTIELKTPQKEPVCLSTHVVHTTATVGQTTMRKGQTTELTLTVDAGQISAKDGGSVSISLMNQSPSVIRIEGNQELLFSSKELSKGPVTRKVKVVAVGAGPFSIAWATRPSFQESHGTRPTTLSGN